MRKTLEELWRGNIDPQVKQVVQGSEYHKIQERIMRSQNRIFEMLNEEQRKYFDIYCETKMTSTTWIYRKPLSTAIGSAPNLLWNP